MAAPSRLREFINADGEPSRATTALGASSTGAIGATSSNSASAYLVHDIAARTGGQDSSNVRQHEENRPESQSSISPSSIQGPPIEYKARYSQPRSSSMAELEAPQTAPQTASGTGNHLGMSPLQTQSSQETGVQTQVETKVTKRSVSLPQLQAMEGQNHTLSKTAADHSLILEYAKQQNERYRKDAAKHNMSLPDYIALMEVKHTKEAAKLNVSVKQYLDMKVQKWLEVEAAKRKEFVQAQEMQRQKIMKEAALKFNMTVAQFMENHQFIESEAVRLEMTVWKYREMQEKRCAEAEAEKLGIPFSRHFDRTQAARFNLTIPQYQKIAAAAEIADLPVPQYVECNEQLHMKAAKLNMTVPIYQKCVADAAKLGMTIHQFLVVRKQKQLAQEAAKLNMTIPQLKEKRLGEEAAKLNMSVFEFVKVQKQRMKIAVEAAKPNTPIPNFGQIQKQQKEIVNHASTPNVYIPQFIEIQQKKIEEAATLNMIDSQFLEKQKEKRVAEEAAKRNMSVAEFRQKADHDLEMDAAKFGLTISQYLLVQSEIATVAAKQNMTPDAYLATWEHEDMKRRKATMTEVEYNEFVQRIKDSAAQSTLPESQYMARHKLVEICAGKHGLDMYRFGAIRRQIDSEARAKKIKLTAPEYLAKMQAGIVQTHQQTTQQQKKRGLSDEDDEDGSAAKKRRSDDKDGEDGSAAKKRGSDDKDGVDGSAAKKRRLDDEDEDRSTAKKRRSDDRTARMDLLRKED